MKISIIFNPTAGRRRWEFVNAVKTELRVRGASVSLVSTSGPGDAQMLAREYSRGDSDIIVAAGGDGTINEVANGLIESGVGKLGIIPLGTANLVALEIGQKPKPESVVDTLLKGESRSIHVGRIDGRHFLIMAGVGFDAEVVAAVNLRLKKRVGKAAYAWSTLKQMRQFSFPTFEVEADGKTYQAASVVVCKSRYYAGPYILAPTAVPTEPHFELCLFTQKGVASVARYGLAMLRNRLVDCSGIKRIKCRDVRIRCMDETETLVQADGEIFGPAPAEAAIVENALELFYPAWH